MNISNIVNTVTNTLEASRIPANILPAQLLKCTALQRPGLSAIKIAAEIIRNNKAIGIENEENPDGSPNLINQYTYNVVRTFVQALKNDASVQSVIPSGSLSVFAKGANGGGPVICKGSNLFDSIGNGIIQ
jgi:hypothetical protein